ncbi:MAG: transcriptional regulator [Capnocytophaga sp.]|nr:transcriptional regulator [Capnocytophaga sp.]
METTFVTGERVLVSPQITGEVDWIEATITEIENNKFVGIVINVITDDGIMFFEKQDMFKHLSERELCTQ